MRSKQNRLIRASEVGEYVFCARAWKLRLDGHNPVTGRAARDAGQQWHKRHGRSVRRVKLLKRIAAAAGLLAFLLLVLLVWWSSV